MTRTVNVTLEHTVSTEAVSAREFRRTYLTSSTTVTRPAEATETVALGCEHCHEQVYAKVDSPARLAKRRWTSAAAGAGMLLLALASAGYFLTTVADTSVSVSVPLLIVSLVATTFLLPWSIVVLYGALRESGVSMDIAKTRDAWERATGEVTVPAFRHRVGVQRT
ncbi:hypothetical protein CLV63_14019 [Murinocardiopsis flavida]|uniref:Uncharacterized protein n=1 Tax=Murinocardiopsis flavida TaxID=645275 RepID=A0A2P8CF00_9ACTN|nr:hypothetical protein [Murinocardiopsis flavida]PSK83567.1 hypothetical protein CLV63_14019 [Murinocardiopsis flavida]